MENTNNKHTSEIVIQSIASSGKLDPAFAKCVGEGYISLDFIQRSLDKYFSLRYVKSDKAAGRLADWLVEYYNHIIEMYRSEFDNAKSASENNWLFNPWGWYGITCFASMIKESSDWKAITSKAMSLVDWSDMSMVSGISDNIEIKLLKKFKEVCCLSVQRK